MPTVFVPVTPCQLTHMAVTWPDTQQTHYKTPKHVAVTCSGVAQKAIQTHLIIFRNSTNTLAIYNGNDK